jgi:hypothetical protein
MNQGRHADHRHARAKATERKRHQRDLRRQGLRVVSVTIPWIPLTELLIEKRFLLACDCDDPPAVRHALEEYLRVHCQYDL